MRKKLGFILCLFALLSMPGCWSRTEPKNLAIVDSVIYDLAEGGGYQIIQEVVNTAALTSSQSGVAQTGGSPTIITISEGPSIPEAIRNSNNSLEHQLFGGHNRVRFFSEAFAQNDIISLQDYVARDHLTDENPLMVVVKGADPKLIYSSTLGLADTVGDFMESISKSQPKSTSKSVFVDALNFIKDYYEEGKQPVAGVVEVVEYESKDAVQNAQIQQGSQDNKKYRLVCEGLAAFKDDKLVGFMDGIDARAYNFITNRIGNTIVSIQLEDGITVGLIHDAKANIKTSVESGRVVIDVKIKIYMSIIQESGTLDITKTGPLKTVEEEFDKELQTQIAAAIKKAQIEFKSDIFGFGSALHRQNPEKWKELKENWDDLFSTAKINVTIDSTVDREGEIKYPFQMEGCT